MSVLIACGGYAALALANIIDKFLVEHRVSPAVLTFFSSAPLFPLVLAWFIPALRAPLRADALLVVMSGVSFIVALQLMFSAYRRLDVSRAAPFTGAATVCSVAAISVYVGDISWSLNRVSGCVLLVGAMLLFSYRNSRQRDPYSYGSVALCMLAGLLFAVSHISANVLYGIYGFVPGIIATRGCMGVVGLLLLAVPSVHRSIRTTAVRHTENIALVMGNRVLGIVGVGAQQLATALGNVVVVNALQGVHFSLIVVGTMFMERWYPNVLREHTTSADRVREMAAVVATAGGLWLVF